MFTWSSKSIGDAFDRAHAVCWTSSFSVHGVGVSDKHAGTAKRQHIGKGESFSPVMLIFSLVCLYRKILHIQTQGLIMLMRPYWGEKKKTCARHFEPISFICKIITLGDALTLHKVKGCSVKYGQVSEKS